MRRGVHSEMVPAPAHLCQSNLRRSEGERTGAKLFYGLFQLVFEVFKQYSILVIPVVHLVNAFTLVVERPWIKADLWQRFP